MTQIRALVKYNLYYIVNLLVDVGNLTDKQHIVRSQGFSMAELDKKVAETKIPEP